MELFDILNSERDFFVLDDIEDKKMKGLITQVNKQMKDLLKQMEDFEEFAKSQLEGEYHDKIVMAKSLQKVYPGWATINNACSNLLREENNLISSFNTSKKALISNLGLLLKDAYKVPVVCSYDVYNNNFTLAKKDHSIIILGTHNTVIVDCLVDQINNNFLVEGNFEKVNVKELEANYSNVDKNVSVCKEAINDMFSSKPSKEEKALALVENMEKAARDLVFFATYKKDIKDVGCVVKEVDLYEKDLFKKYVPIKKQLTKLLKVNFVDVCDLSHDEGEYPTQEFKAIDDLFDE